MPLVGTSMADNVVGEEARYSYKMSPTQLESAWNQCQVHFRECPACKRIVCLSDFDTLSGFCQDDSPRTEEISEPRGAQAGAAIKGFATAFGLGDALKNVGRTVEAASTATMQMAHCHKDGTLAAQGTKFCPECGTPMAQPAATLCPNCGVDTYGAKFCPNCGTKMELAPTKCPNCGAETKGAKFCPECGTKLG
jgi:rubrerythrin